MLNVFIGYDQRQPVAFQVAAHSIWKHASYPVAITRLQLNQLPIKKTGLTEFTYSRFLVPYLCQFQGTAERMSINSMRTILHTLSMPCLSRKTQSGLSGRR